MPETSRLMDVNVLAVFLVEDHPGHAFVEPRVRAGLQGVYPLWAPDSIPLRVRWILTHKLGFPKTDADRVIQAFLEHRRVHYAAATRGTYQRAYALAHSVKHDVYDTFLIAQAEEVGAAGLLTTDAGLKGACEWAGLEYENPVPASVLRDFSRYQSR